MLFPCSDWIYQGLPRIFQDRVKVVMNFMLAKDSA